MYQNRISLIGFVGNNAQLKSTKNGTPVAVLSVATKSSWKNGKDEYDSRTEWHRCTAWGKLAEFAGNLEKGAHVQIEGELRYREYKKDRGSDADAAPIIRRLAEIHANRILKLDRAANLPAQERLDMPTQMPALLSTIPIDNFEPYVSVEKAAQYLDLKPKTLLAKARKGQIPAYPWGDGVRKTWRFKISQLDDWMKSKLHSPRRPPFSERRGFQ